MYILLMVMYSTAIVIVIVIIVSIGIDGHGDRIRYNFLSLQYSICISRMCRVRHVQMHQFI